MRKITTILIVLTQVLFTSSISSAQEKTQEMKDQSLLLSQNEDLNDFCDKFPYNSRCEGKPSSSPEANIPSAELIDIEGDWRDPDADIPWSELVLIRSDFESFYAIFDRNYKKSGGFLTTGSEQGIVTRWRQDEVDVYFYQKSGCDAILGCSSEQRQLIGNSLEISVGSEVYPLYGDDGTFPISFELRNALQEASKQTPVSIRVNGGLVSEIGDETVEAMARLYSIEDSLQSNPVDITIAALPPKQGESTVKDLVSFVTPSVVQIKTKQGTGTGFILNEDGYILTNRHVVRRSKEVQITLYDETEYQARVIKRDRLADVALLKIESSFSNDLSGLPVCYANYPTPGEKVIVVGFPLSLGSTVTRGIVSGIRQKPNETLIQTDAPVNPGNSGSPLVNEFGEAVGIINSGIGGGAQGIGFAVAIPQALEKLGVSLDRPTNETNTCGNPKSRDISTEVNSDF